MCQKTTKLTLVISTIYQVIRTLRPRQWLKNASVFAAAFFAGTFFDIDIIVLTVKAFIAFCFTSSVVYIINDIVDAPKDREHPTKKNRPIASGKLSENLAWVIAIVLGVITLFYSFTSIGTYFTLAVIFYIVMQILYSLYFRNIIIMDSLVVATGFVIRVFAGGLVSTTSISSWLALTTIGISLLMAFGKRRSEKTLVEKKFGLQELRTRKTLRHYPDTLLDSMISMSATYTILTYSLFTFQVSPQNISNSFASILPSILRSPKWMMLTIPLVIYGVARYLYVIYEKKEGESPARVLLSDYPLLTVVSVWIFFVWVIIYALPLLS